ncbi:hypothetical protein Pla175_43990 [Pirellulimonas nuda]|uniref:DUF6268 domain-containing protein n=1 Tax=Pirellulimonas nuda TaxID=2528009 RepID=A0A518DHN8_9BACT|nr:DUF6268 family outer membrane beta-barrel protein [Pirellulimonas nuda]QDU90984.1 hypothetical protein Pla175_43990 [Pirellulimonas nuda]
MARSAVIATAAAATILLGPASACVCGGWFADDPIVFVEPSPILEGESAGSLGAARAAEDTLQTPPLEILPPPSKQASGPPKDDRSPFRSQSYWIGPQNVRSQPGDWSQAGQQINLAAPIFIAPEGGNLWLATGSVDHTSIGATAVLPDSGLPVPDDLWKVQAGAMNIRDLENGWKTVAILTVGYASDQPFTSLRDATFTAIGGLEVPRGERDAWSFSLFYSPTSQLPFPLPGVAYIWRPNDQFTANLGVPFSLRYRPTERFSVVASYFPLTNVNILARQELTDAWSLYGGYQVVNETYWLADRAERNERFYLFDQRVKVGLQRSLLAGLTLDLSAGYVFDRQAFQADGFSDNRRDEIAIDPSAFGALQLSWSL